MELLIFYNIGATIAFILSLILLFKEDKEEKESGYYLQAGMIAPLTLLSWISVMLIIYRFIKDKNCLA